MITEKVLKLWFKDISEPQIKELQNIYNKSYDKYKDKYMEINLQEVFNNLFDNFKKYDETKDFTIAKITMVNKAKFDVVKNFYLLIF